MFINNRNLTTHDSLSLALLSVWGGNCNLSNVTSVREVVIARAHITVLPWLRDAETWRITGGWRVIKLSL